MRSRLLAAALLFLVPAPASAWWDYGHVTVARIAASSVKPSTAAAIRKLLARGDLLDTPQCPVRTIEEASIWPDCIKQLGERFSYSSPWHYQNVDVCKPFDSAGPCRDGNCVSAQIKRNLKLLADRKVPVRERLMALAFVMHLVGDLHMPLHAGDRSDRGGSDFIAAYGVIGGKTNLHMIWDGYLAERAISTPAGEAAGILKELPVGERQRTKLGTVDDWARESWEAARQQAYGSLAADPCALTIRNSPVLDEAATRRLIPFVRRQIARGGLRLARLLDETLG